jgi:Domain of unknown function (DUF4159)
MNFPKALALLCGGLALAGVVCAFQRPFRQFPGVEYSIGEIPLPEDYQEKTEWAFARLMYPPGEGGINGYFHRDLDWHIGRSDWTQDFPRADRHFSLAVRRLTRLHVRSVEQCVNLDEGDAYDWPWLYAVQVGEWGLTHAQTQALREYLLRGGFFMADDFHGKFEWDVFEKVIKEVFPDRQIVDVPDNDPIFHSIYDVSTRLQVPGWAWRWQGFKTPQYAVSRDDGKGAHWRAIYDDHGRVMVAISYNSDIGDAWEWADNVQYPEKLADQSIRMGVNYIIYSMTH